MATGLGIDIGSETIKVVQARVSGGTVTVTGAHKVPRAGVTVLDAPVEDSGSTLPADLGQELKRAGLRRAGTVGISGRDILLKYLTTPPIPPDKLKMFIDLEIGGKTTARRSADDAPAVTYDYRLLNVPSGLKGDLVIMAGLAKNEFLFGMYASLKAAGVEAAAMTPSCFGLVNTYLRTQKIPDKETVVLVDVGHELIEIAILEENHVFFARSAPGGGKKFTTGLDKILKVGDKKAAEFKHERARLYPEGTPIPSKQELAFQAVLKEGAENIAGAIRSSVMFCRTQAKMPKLDYQRVILSGGGARLNGLRDYLEKKIGRPVTVLDLYKSLDLRKLDAASARCFEGDIPDMAVALGLAIVDADPGSFHFALTPERLVKKRIFLQKTVYGIAAGVVLLVGLAPQIKSSSDAAAAAMENVKIFEDKQEKAQTEKKQFQDKLDESHALKRSLDYYLWQTRMGPRYLDFFTSLRANTPHDISLLYVGPPDAAHDARDSGPMRHFVVRGNYEQSVYPDTKFNEAWDAMRKKLLEVPGITKAELEPSADSETLRPGLKAFQLNIFLEDPGTAAASTGGKTIPASKASDGAAP